MELYGRDGAGCRVGVGGRCHIVCVSHVGSNSPRVWESEHACAGVRSWSRMGPKPIPEWELELLRERRARRLQRERALRIGRWYHLAFLAWLEDYGAQVALVRACQRLVDALEVERLGDEWELVLAGWIGGRGLAVPAPNADPLLLQLPWRED